MKKFFRHVQRVLNGREQMTDRLKYSVMIYSVALVHLFLACIFMYLNIKPLYLFNTASVLAYLFATHLIRRETYLPVYYITYFEIILHSFVATLCIGWQFGFAQYIIAIIPVGFYICYTMNTRHRKTTIATISAVAAAVAFLCCKLLASSLEPLYPIKNRTLELSLYIFNSICTFLFLILFSLIFIMEMRIASTKLRHQNAILEQLANTDPLTGLYNRRSMNLFLDQALQSDTSFSLIMCDIDNFKKVNDTYGHDFGDVVLHDIAEITVNQVNEHGYVCRWGGEEILILISNSPREKTLQIAENIRRRVDNHVFELNGKWIRCTLTLGVALYEEGKTLEEIISMADYNLYRGKRNGKNKVVI